jgi:hypothetical protein
VQVVQVEETHQTVTVVAVVVVEHTANRLLSL